MSAITFITATARDRAGTPVVVRLAGGGTSAPFLRDGQHFWAGLFDRPRFRAELGYGRDGWTGGTVPTTGEIAWMPAEPARLALLAGLYWPDAAVTVEGGPEAGPIARLLTGTVANAAVADGILKLTVADLSAAIDKPLAPATFAGTGEIEGPAEATGKPKRRSWGLVFNIEARPLVPAYEIHEVGDPARPLGAITVVRDKGRAGPLEVLDWQGSAGATLAALKNRVPPRGGAVAAPSIACVRWWTTPSGPLTCDLVGEVGTASAVAPIASAILAAVAGPPIADPAAAGQLRPAPAGLHVATATETAAQALDRLLLGVSLLWVLDPAGVVRVREWTFQPVAEAPVRARFMARERTLPPTAKRRVGHRLNNRVHTAAEISAALLVDGVEEAITTTRSPTPPPETPPIGSLHIDERNVPYRFEGLELTAGDDPLTIGGSDLRAPGYIEALPEAIRDGEFQVEIVPPAAQIVYTDVAGAPLAAQFPRVLAPVVTRGGVDVRTADDVGYTLTTSGVTAAVEGARGHPDKGLVTVTAARTGSLALTITAFGRAYGPYRVLFTVQAASAPATGGEGAKVASDSTFPHIAAAALQPIAGPLTVTVAAGQEVRCTLPAEYALVEGGRDNGAAMVGRWQAAVAGSGGWTDAPGTTIVGGRAESSSEQDPEPLANGTRPPPTRSSRTGAGLFNQVFAGLAAGTWDLRFMAGLDAPVAAPALEIFNSTATVRVAQPE